ncbi:MAG: hypothetical protein KAR40_01325 [Candidatus Sabulitectum sp.]|nr:hypothetical protein [Candidatus Sabulitectum sp.]
MKTYLLSLIFTSLVLATGDSAVISSPMGGADQGDLFNQTYSFPQIVSAYGDPLNRIADDFILSANNSLWKIVIWTCYNGTQPLPDHFALEILLDNGDVDPSTASPIWQEWLPCTRVDTGDNFIGRDIYETVFFASSPPALEAGERYWLSVQIPSGYAAPYVMVKNNEFDSVVWVKESSWKTSEEQFGHTTDMFFDLYSVSSSMEGISWASVKTSF